MIYTIEGTLIGDAHKFIEHMKEKFDLKGFSMTKDSQKRRTQQNIKMINEYMRKVRHRFLNINHLIFLWI